MPARTDIPLKGRANKTDEDYMRLALDYAARSAKADEVPVGCVIVREGRVIAWGRNRREKKKNPLLHAEIEAIGRAARALKGWRLIGCTLYVTLEPCPMCAGAIINARVPRVVFGAHDFKAGCFGSACDMRAMGFNHRPEVSGGVLEKECAAILSDFFKKKRK